MRTEVDKNSQEIKKERFVMAEEIKNEEGTLCNGGRN